jgi:hypothetical protein
MGRVNRHRSQNGIHLPGKKQVHRILARPVKTRHRQDADSLPGKRGQKLLVPAVVLVGHERMYFLGKTLELFRGRQPVRTGERISVFHLLQKSGYTYFHEFIQVAGGDGQEFDPLEQRIAFVLGLFQNATVKGQPGFVAIEIVAGVIQADT